MTKTLLIACSSLALAGCGGQDVRVGYPAPPPEWLACSDKPGRPSLKPLEAKTTPGGAPVYDKSEVDKRDAQIVPHILALDAAHFDCFNKLSKVREYFQSAPPSPAQTD